MRIVNETKGSILGSRVVVARSFWQRFLGLMFRRSLDEGAGLVVDPCSSIHTMWMRFPIDVLYVDERGVIVRADDGMQPWRIGPLFSRGKFVVELPRGVIAMTGTTAGDQISLQRAEQTIS